MVDASIHVVHSLSQEIALILNGYLSTFLLSSNKLVDWAYRHVFHEVLIHWIWGSKSSLIKTLVELRKEVFLDVDAVPALWEILTDRENCISPERSLKHWIFFTDKAHDKRSKLI